jgi:hypothetical protein
MKIKEVYAYYDNSWAHAMRKLGFARSAYSNWLKIGRIPISTQRRIEIITQKELLRGEE